MRPILTIVDDFLPNAHEVREKAILYGFRTEMFEGVNYPTVGIDYIPPEILAGMSELYGNKPINALVMAFRQCKLNSPMHKLVHSDNTTAELAAVLYLNPEGTYPSGTGTAFWRHRETGWEHQPTEREMHDAGVSLEALANDKNVPELWDLMFVAPAKFNRLITYPTTAFHSRWPWEGFGTTDEDARLIHAAFYNVL
jgi:hypothetical protein